MEKTSKSLIPVLNQKTGINGFAISSSIYSASYDDWRAFNQDTLDGWASLNGVPQWLGYSFNKKTVVTRYSIRYGASIGYEIKSWTFEGSNDNFATFDVLDKKTSYSYLVNSSTKQEFEIVNKKAYSKYRINVTENYHSIPPTYIDELEFYGYEVEVKAIIKNPSTNQCYSLADKTLILLPDGADETIVNHGIEAGKEIQLSEEFDKVTTVGIDSTITTETVASFSVYDYISETPQLLIYNESEDDLVVSTTVKPFSVYDHISENPQVIIYTESLDDITVSTTTEPYDLYEEFGDEIEVLYYTDDESVAEADLILEANWSPVDELDGDLEVVTWTDEPQETAQRVLEITAIPKPQFVKLVNPKRLYGYLDDVVATDVSKSFRDEARYLFSGQDSTKWYVWNKKEKVFFLVDASTDEMILKNGMKYTDLSDLTESDWRAWKDDYMNIGVFLKDNPRDTITSIIDNVSYQDYLPRNSSEITDASLYILNTTAKIDISLDGAILKGFLSDDDLTRVQYRVLVNGENYYPTNGEFTKLGESPQNIELILKSDSIKIDDWNTVKIEFQDFFGTVDYWQTTFIGTYSGLMFKDILGEYYSNEAGKVLQYLDFGVIIAGQTTIEHEILLKNQYGYDVENIYLYANTSNFPVGMKIEFSNSLSPFSPQPELKLDGVLKNNDEMSFFIRLKTDLHATPDANGSFDITVRADKA